MKQKIENTRKKEFLCDYCNKSWNTEMQLKNHRAQAHGDLSGTAIITVSMPNSVLAKIKKSLEKINQEREDCYKLSRSKFISDCVLKVIDENRDSNTR